MTDHQDAPSPPPYSVDQMIRMLITTAEAEQEVSDFLLKRIINLEKDNIVLRAKIDLLELMNGEPCFFADDDEIGDAE